MPFRRTADFLVPVIALALLPAGASAAPPQTPVVHASVQEVSSDLFLDNLKVYWRTVQDPAVVRYRIRWSTQPDLSDGTDRTVNQNANAWIETTLSIGFRLVFDHQRVYVGVASLDGTGAASDYLVTSATLGELPSLRGDVNEDGRTDIGDPLALLDHLFLGEFRPSTYSLSYSSDSNGDKRLDLADVLFTLVWLFGGGPAPVDDVPAMPPGSVLFGMFYGDSRQAMYKDMAPIRAEEAWQEKRNTVLNVFTTFTSTDMADLFAFQLNNIWNNRNVPFISWQPVPFSPTPPDIEVQVATGKYDAFIRGWADRLKTWLSGPDRKFGAPGSTEIRDDRRVYLRFAHEMNGWWTAWNATTGNNKPADYVSMWRRVHDILTNEFALDASHVQWVWCVMNIDADNTNGQVFNPAEQYYPGHAYVDWLSIDGYNWGFSQTWSTTWDLPDKVFDGNFSTNRMLTRLKALAPTKPICVAEFGTTSVTSRTPPVINVEEKARWVKTCMNYFLTSKVKMVLYFNYDKETDWAVFGTRGDLSFTHSGRTYVAYSSYRDSIRSNRYQSTVAGETRLLTDEQFAGKF
jgi:beta-mannanase